MWTFIIAGAVYLIGVGVVLVLRPAFMFTPDGTWKEFGIGQRDDRYTPFPFWLFCLTWALLSYVLVLLLKPYFSIPESSEVPVVNTNRKTNNRRRAPSLPPEDLEEVWDEPSAEKAVELPKGYYVLNKKATKLSGVPKYVYLGPQEPSD
jgi:hypothetical protein